MCTYIYHHMYIHMIHAILFISELIKSLSNWNQKDQTIKEINKNRQSKHDLTMIPLGLRHMIIMGGVSTGITIPMKTRVKDVQWQKITTVKSCLILMLIDLIKTCLNQMLVKYDRNGCVWRLLELMVKCISTLEHKLIDCHSIIQRIVNFIQDRMLNHCSIVSYLDGQVLWIGIIIIRY